MRHIGKASVMFAAAAMAAAIVPQPGPEQMPAPPKAAPQKRGPNPLSPRQRKRQAKLLRRMARANQGDTP